MATTEEIKTNLHLLDDNMRQDYVDVYSIVKGDTAPTLNEFPKFQSFRHERSKDVITNAARSLIKFGKGDLVLDILFEKLSLMVVWGRKRAFERPSRQMWPDPDWLVNFRLAGKAIFERSAEVAGWILGSGLPGISGVDWGQLAAAVSNHANLRSTESYKVFTAQMRVLDNARPFAVGVEGKLARPSRRSRAKKGESPPWLPEALILLQRSDGQMVDYKIAKEIEVSPSTLSRCEEWAQARAAFGARESTVGQQLRASARKAKTTPEHLLSGEETDD